MLRRLLTMVAIATFFAFTAQADAAKLHIGFHHGHLHFGIGHHHGHHYRHFGHRNYGFRNYGFHNYGHVFGYYPRVTRHYYRPYVYPSRSYYYDDCPTTYQYSAPRVYAPAPARPRVEQALPQAQPAAFEARRPTRGIEF